MAISDRLTNKGVEGARPREKLYKLHDGRGMYLAVLPSGTRTWRLKYRALDGREMTYTIGQYPDISLKRARELRDEARSIVAERGDPVQERREVKEQAREVRRDLHGDAAEDCFSDAAAGRYGKTMKPWSATHKRDIRRIIDGPLAKLATKPIATISTKDCQRIIDEVVARKAYTYAKDVKTYGNMIFAYWNKGRPKGKKIESPWIDVEVRTDPEGVVSHPALPRAELGTFMRSVRNSPSTPLTRLGLLMLLHTGVRSGELRNATFGEFNVADRLWTISGKRMKNGLDHLVPLSDEVVDLLAQIRAANADLRGIHLDKLRPDDLLFPNAFDTSRCISDVTWSHAVWRAGYKRTMSPHGCRSCFRDWCSEIGKFQDDAIERQLAHVERNKTKGAYARAKHLPERTEMMRGWSAWLAEQERGAAMSTLRRSLRKGSPARNRQQPPNSTNSVRSAAIGSGSRRSLS